MSETLTPRMQAVLDYVKEHPGCTTPELAEGVGQGTNGARERLNVLYAFGFIGRQASGLSNLPTRWFPEDLNG